MNEQLIAQCRANPDDPQPWAVLADALIDAGDPLGEYAALVVADKLEEAEAILAAHEVALYGGEDLARSISEVEHRHGFVVAARISGDPDPAYFASPHATFLERLAYDGSPSMNELVARLGRSPLAPWLRALRIDDHDDTDVEEVVALLPGLPALRSLDLPGTLEMLPLVDALPSTITHLGLQDAADGQDLLEVLAGMATLNHLRSLDLTGGMLATNSARILLEHRARFAHLERLALDHCYFTEAEVAQISAALPRASLEEQQSYEGDDPRGGDRFLVLGE